MSLNNLFNTPLNVVNIGIETFKTAAEQAGDGLVGLACRPVDELGIEHPAWFHKLDPDAQRRKFIGQGL